MEKGEKTEEYKVRPEVLTVDDVVRLVPKLEGHRKAVSRILHWIGVDRVNRIHSRYCDTPGPEFARRLVFDEFKVKLRIDNEEILDNLPEGPFVTVSNHPFGQLDGITLIYLISSRRPKYKVMVNMILNQISAMRPNYIAVDAMQSADPKKKAVSMTGIRQVIKNVREGNPVGFFPAGAVSKWDRHFDLTDREWQPTVISLIKQLKVPVIPIFFHGDNSFLFNFLGVTCWQLRTLMLPRELFRKTGKDMHISIGRPISVEEQQKHQESVKEFGEYLKAETYKLRKEFPK